MLTENQRGITEPLKKAQRRKRKKPSFDEFLLSIQSAVERADQRGHAIAFGLVKKGCSGDISSEQLQRTIELLRKWPEVDRLAVHLGVEQRNGKLRPFARQVSTGLRMGFVLVLGYPLQTPAGSDVHSLIIQWLEISQVGVISKQIQPQKEVSDLREVDKRSQLLHDKELRAKFICLLGESNDAIVHEGIYTLLGRFSKKKSEKTRKALLPGQAFVRLVGSALASARIPKNAVDNILNASAPLADVVAGLQERHSILTRRLETAERRIAVLEEKEGLLTGKLVQSNEGIARRDVLIEEKDNAIGAWEGRYEALDKHWREVLREKLAKQAGDLKKRIAHEVNEAKLSLSGSQPDTRMASDRLAQIQEILQGLE